MKLRYIAMGMLLFGLVALVSAQEAQEWVDDNTEVNEVLCWDGNGLLVQSRYCEGVPEPEGEEISGDVNNFHKTRFVGTRAQLRDIERQNPTFTPMR